MDEEEALAEMLDCVKTDIDRELDKPKRPIKNFVIFHTRSGLSYLADHAYASNYCLGDRVLVDGHKDIIAIVDAIMVVASDGPLQYRVSWIANGACHQYWFPEFRITKA